jgi:hypothetical protein
MKTILSALLGGLIMLGGTGLAQAGTQADTVAPTKVQQTAGQSKVAIAEQVRAPGSLVLTDSQMDIVTAGHYSHDTRYRGYYRNYNTLRCPSMAGGLCRMA